MPERDKISPHGGLPSQMTHESNDSGAAEADRAVQMERALLAALCQSPRDDAARAEILQLLPRYRWQSSDHRLIYEAVASASTDAAAIRSNLAARLTRMGFPDVEIDFCFEPPSQPEGALAWLRSQFSATASDHAGRDDSPPHPSGDDSPQARIHRTR